MNALENELEEFENFSTAIEILLMACEELLDAELFNSAENLLSELENIVIVFRQSKGE